MVGDSVVAGFVATLVVDSVVVGLCVGNTVVGSNDAEIIAVEDVVTSVGE